MRFEQQISVFLRPAGAVALGICLFASDRVVFASGQQATPQTPAAATQAMASSEVQVSADDAVRMALENNLGIQAARLSPQAQALAIAQTRSAYAPNLLSTVRRSSSSNPPSDFLTASDVVTSQGFSSSGGINQLLKWGGGNYQLTLDGARSTTNNSSSTFNPNLSSNLNFNYTQPLLRNFAIDSTRQQLALGEKQAEIVDVQLQQQITQMSRNVRNAYFDLVGAIRQLEVSQASLQLAQQQLKDNQTKVEVGTMAPIDIIEAQAEVSQREEAIIVNEAQIKTLEDNLRTLVMNPKQADFWTTRIVPTEQPQLTPQAMDVDAAIAKALATRTDLIQARKQIEQTDISMKYARNQRLPTVNAVVNYGLTGNAGTRFQYQRDPATGLPIGEPTPVNRAFSDALRDVFGNEFKTWSLRFDISYPLGQSTAEAALAQARVTRQQDAANLQLLETQVVASVRNAARQVETSLKRVEATQRARQFAEQRYEAEQKRMTVGLSTTFQLFQAQRDLSNQKLAELNAIIAYNRALIDFEAVQTVPIR